MRHEFALLSLGSAKELFKRLLEASLVSLKGFLIERVLETSLFSVIEEKLTKEICCFKIDIKAVFLKKKRKDI